MFQLKRVLVLGFATVLATLSISLSAATQTVSDAVEVFSPAANPGFEVGWVPTADDLNQVVLMEESTRVVDVSIAQTDHEELYSPMIGNINSAQPTHSATSSYEGLTGQSSTAGNTQSSSGGDDLAWSRSVTENI